MCETEQAGKSSRIAQEKSHSVRSHYWKNYRVAKGAFIRAMTLIEKAAEHRRTPRRKRQICAVHHGHVLECGSALPLLIEGIDFAGAVPSNDGYA